MNYDEKKIKSIELNMELDRMATDTIDADLRITIGLAEILGEEIKSNRLVIEDVSTCEYPVEDKPVEVMPFWVL